MWDEEKFFKDYVAETDNVVPDEDFIKSLKKMASEEPQPKKGYAWVRYVAAAAAVILCVAAGFMAWNIRHSGNGGDTGIGSGKIHAGPDKEVQPGKTKIITVKTILSFMEDGTTEVEDIEGNAIEEDVRSELIGMLERAVSTDARPTEDMKYDEYICKGETEIGLKVYEDGYIEVRETGMVYKII